MLYALGGAGRHALEPRAALCTLAHCRHIAGPPSNCMHMHRWTTWTPRTRSYWVPCHLCPSQVHIRMRVRQALRSATDQSYSRFLLACAGGQHGLHAPEGAGRHAVCTPAWWPGQPSRSTARRSLPGQLGILQVRQPGFAGCTILSMTVLSSSVLSMMVCMSRPSIQSCMRCH